MSHFKHFLSSAVLLCVLAVVWTGCMRREYVPARQTSTTTPAPISAPHQLTLAGPITLGEPIRATAPADPSMALGYAFSAVAGAQIKIELDRLVRGVQATVYGPMGEGGVVSPIAQGDGPHILPADGTYVVGVSAPSAVGFTLALECAGEECRLECGPQNECGPGADCAIVQCVTAPCPSYCAAFLGEQPPGASGSTPESTRGSEPSIPGTSGAVCGTRGASPCAGGSFCRHPIEAACGAADLPGVCVTLPTGCTREYVPVCGCDGQTYPNGCAASANGVSVRALETCP